MKSIGTNFSKWWLLLMLSCFSWVKNKLPFGILAVIISILPLLMFEWNPSEAARPGEISRFQFSEKLVSQLPVTPVDEEDFPPPRFTKNIEVGKNDTLTSILRKQGVVRNDINRLLKALSKVYDLRSIRPGQNITVVLSPRTSKPRDNILEKVVVRPNILNEISVARIEQGKFNVYKRKFAVRRKLVKAYGNIETSLYMAAIKSGVPAPVLMNLIRIFSWDVDFQRGIREGDKFEVLFEGLFTDDGEFLRYGNILYGNLILQGQQNPLYRFKTTKGLTDYFDRRGKSARKALMRTPINGARLSSGFGKRRHPILGYTKMHRGTDFAAPIGTPVYAAGDGIVVRRSRYGAYGKYIRIRHNGYYSTAYAHLSRYNSRIRQGTRVRQGQIIGYVGSTGRSTGPHLHYEVLKGKVRVNPVKVKMPSGIRLRNQDLATFLLHRDSVDRKYAAVVENAKIADSSK